MPVADTLVHNQVSVGTSATEIARERTGRRSITIKNLHASTTLYVGGSGVSSSNGMEVKAGESIQLTTTAAAYGIAASGSVTAAYVEVSD